VRLDARPARAAKLGNHLQALAIAPHEPERASGLGVEQRQRAPQPGARPGDQY